MARFDEETNINWASKLEQAGAHVVFGVVGNKTHAKACLVIRREKSGLKRYVHLGTGNYHPRTARLYEDFGLFTADPQICADVHEIFHQLTGLGKNKPTRRVWHSPFTLHTNVMKAINREMALAKAGKPWARLMPLEATAPQRLPGRLSCLGPLSQPNELLQSMPPDQLADWEGSPLIPAPAQL